MIVSVTHLSAYLYCKRKLYLEQVLKIVEPPKESLVLGSIRHKASDRINKAEQTIVTAVTDLVPFKALLESYKQVHSMVLRDAIRDNESKLKLFSMKPSDVFKELWPSICEDLARRAKEVHEFMMQHRMTGPELWENLSPKFMSEVYVTSEKYSLKGIIDRIAFYPTYCVPIEIKTGTAPREGVWPGHRVQLAAYIMLLEEQMDRPVTKGIVDYLGSQQQCEVHLNPFLRRDVTNLTADVQKLLESSTPPDRCFSGKKCECCGLRVACFDERQIKTKVLNIT
jgi:CRISPR-associated exonuclease Cas4